MTVLPTAMAFKSLRIVMLLCIVMWIENNAEGSPTGMKINDIKYCGNISFMLFCLKFLLIKERLGSEAF